jgi:hypothetical protein
MAWRRPQFHFRQLRDKTDICINCSEVSEPGASNRYSRRAQLRAAVFDRPGREPGAHRPAAPSVATGIIADVLDDAIVLDSGRGARSFAISSDTVTWIGSRTTAAALRPGDRVIVRHRPTGRDPAERLVAERIWARIGRVTGTITATDKSEFVVDTGRPGRPAERVVIAPAQERQIQVRFPRLTPGYLLDVIGTRHGDHLLAVAPATAQPPYRAGQWPLPPLVSGPVPVPISGSAVWHEPDEESSDLLGLGYPALDPEASHQAAGDPAGIALATGATGCVRLPFLSLGSVVRVRNECTDRAAALPVTSDGALARQFCDRCVRCGTSPKGRVADLTAAAFVELGGSLEDGCFNATLTLAG